MRSQPHEAVWVRFYHAVMRGEWDATAVPANKQQCGYRDMARRHDTPTQQAYSFESAGGTLRRNRSSCRSLCAFVKSANSSVCGTGSCASKLRFMREKNTRSKTFRGWYPMRMSVSAPAKNSMEATSSRSAGA